MLSSFETQAYSLVAENQIQSTFQIEQPAHSNPFDHVTTTTTNIPLAIVTIIPGTWSTINVLHGFHIGCHTM